MELDQTGLNEMRSELRYEARVWHPTRRAEDVREGQDGRDGHGLRDGQIVQLIPRRSRMEEERLQVPILGLLLNLSMELQLD